jgi:hypothetical protein
LSSLLGETPFFFLAAASLELGAPALDFETLPCLHAKGRVERGRYAFDVVDRRALVEESFEYLLLGTERHVEPLVDEGPVLEGAPRGDADESVEPGLDEVHPFGTVDNKARVGIDAHAVGDDAVADEVAARAKLEDLRLRVDGVALEDGFAPARAKRIPPVLSRKIAFDRIRPITGAERPTPHPGQDDKFVLFQQVSPPHD